MTIDQGVYGLLTVQDMPDINKDVFVYTAGQEHQYATMSSDGDGVYQIDLPDGEYTLCTSTCTPISTPSSATVRYDWTDGPGGGHWAKI